MLFALIKAPPTGFLATLVIAFIVAMLEGTGTFLHVDRIVILAVTFYWSWPAFLVTTALAFAVFWMIET